MLHTLLPSNSSLTPHQREFHSLNSRVPALTDATARVYLAQFSALPHSCVVTHSTLASRHPPPHNLHTCTAPYHSLWRITWSPAGSDVGLGLIPPFPFLHRNLSHQGKEHGKCTALSRLRLHLDVPVLLRYNLTRKVQTNTDSLCLRTVLPAIEISHAKIQQNKNRSESSKPSLTNSYSLSTKTIIDKNNC